MATRPRRTERADPEPALAAAPLAYLAGASGAPRRARSGAEIESLVRGGRGSLWVHIDTSREEEWLLLEELFGFHPLPIEDTRSPESRLKIEAYPEYLFVVLRGIRFNSWTPQPYDIQTSNLYLFLGPSFVITAHDGPSATVQAVAERIEAGADLLQRGPDHLAYVIIDLLVDYFFPLLDEIDDFVDDLERRIFERPDQTLLARILELKRTLLALRRNLSATREVMGVLTHRPSPLVKPETQLYFRDVYDHTIRQLESVETYRDLLGGVMETHLTVMSHRINEVIKALSVVATVVLPATLIAGIYGMNFQRSWPSWGDPFGFWIALAIMTVVAVGLIGYLWWKKWL